MADDLNRFKIALADRYTLERELCRGVMATVYLAEDLKHHRQVAIKVLRPELAAAIGAERFLREVEVTANLTHPHILPLHDSGEADGFLYYVMPYIEGETLRGRMNREGQLPLDDALQITREVAAALSYAHSHDVIHRDIKPENVLLSAGEAVVADFGIARAITEAGGEHLTETGISIGTPAYMSPEQASGADKLDGRSDVYSLGCVLYEMLAGEPPYTGPSAQAIVAKKLSEATPRISVVRGRVPTSVEVAVEQALAKVPADRFGTAAQFGEVLSVERLSVATHRTPARRKLTVPVLVSIGVVALVAILMLVAWPFSAEPEGPPRLVVLPFENLGSPDDEQFADGLTDEIISRLSNLSGLFVISRTSAMQYKDHEMTLPEIGAELSVDYVLEGTVRVDRVPDGVDQVRIIPQLIRVSDDAPLWSEPGTVELAAGDIFRVQAEIAERVAGALDVTLLEPERQRLAARPTDNLEAYDYYLRGHDYFHRNADEQTTRASVLMYENAVRLDPDFALAYARLCRAHMRMWWLVYDRTEQRVTAAKEAVDQALRLAPDLPEAHWALAFYYYQGQLDYESALAEFAIARKGQPNNSELFFGIAAVQRRQGKFEEAAANFKKATELDPRSAVRVNEVAETYFLLRNPTEAGRFYDRAISLTPDWAAPYGNKAAFLHLRLEGSAERAALVLEEAERAGIGEDVGIVYSWILLKIWDGDYEEALDRLASISSEFVVDFQDRFVPKAQLHAEIYGLMGSRQLEQAYYDSARSVLEARVEQRPDDSRYRSALGIAYAGLGRREDAIREGESAVELLPMSKEAYMGAYRAEDLARIYTTVGEYDAAIDQLEILLAVPSPTSVAMLRVDPTWNLLRGHPRFQRLLEEYGN
jgi:serine/threonine-protein kinase